MLKHEMISYRKRQENDKQKFKTTLNRKKDYIWQNKMMNIISLICMM